MATIPLGALCKQTRNYIYPSVASKEKEYVCPECNRDLILVKGNQRIHHFRHKVNTINPCMHYDNPGESQIHKDAKCLLKTLIENNIQINIQRKCKCCADIETYEIPDFTVDTSKIILEYRFEYNDGFKIADVAYLDNDEIVCIFEICHTHATCANDRPEPWFEIDATTLLLEANKQNTNKIDIWCIRAEKCDKCVKYELEYVANNTKNAINKLAQWLKERKPINIYWSCGKLQYNGIPCSTHHGGMDCSIKYEDNDEVLNDYVNNTILYSCNKTVKYVFHMNSMDINHDTKEQCFVIESEEILNPDIEYEFDDGTIVLTCLLDNKDRYCDNCRILSEPWVLNLPRLCNRIGWRQEQPCILCKRTAYAPVYVKGYRQICKICLCEDEVKKLYQNVNNKCIIDISDL